MKNCKNIALLSLEPAELQASICELQVESRKLESKLKPEPLIRQIQSAGAAKRAVRLQPPRLRAESARISAVLRRVAPSRRPPKSSNAKPLSQSASSRGRLEALERARTPVVVCAGRL